MTQQEFDLMGLDLMERHVAMLERIAKALEGFQCLEGINGNTPCPTCSWTRGKSKPKYSTNGNTQCPMCGRKLGG